MKEELDDDDDDNDDDEKEGEEKDDEDDDSVVTALRAMGYITPNRSSRSMSRSFFWDESLD